MNPDKTFFTSDQHFWHKKIIDLCDRPFASVEEMNSEIISQWQQTVPQDGHVFVVGDLFFCGTTKAIEILSQLPGTKYLIRGNHDEGMKPSVRDYFEWIKDYHELNVSIDNSRHKFVLCHYPMISWNRAYHGSFMLHGHSHANCAVLRDHRILDVGVDQAYIDLGYYRPFSMRYIVEALSENRTENSY